MKDTSPAFQNACPAAQPATPSANIAARRIRLVAETQAAGPQGSAPIWEPVTVQRGAIPTTTRALNETRHPEQLSSELEQAIVATLTRALLPGETHQVGNDNRERELKQLLAQLTPLEALHLRRRLDLDRDSDPVAVAFRRMVVERRQRLRAFLSDPRRAATSVKQRG